MKKKSTLKDRIEEIEELNKAGVDNSATLYHLQKIWKERGKENERDKEIYKRFREIAEEGKERNKNRFRLEYVNKLGLPWNILILLGKKNIGKTYQIHRLVDECIREDRGLVLLRTRVKEANTAIEPLLNETISKIRVKPGKNNTFDLVLKEEYCSNPKKVYKIGFFASISSLTSYQGASYEKVKYIIWDECISDGGAVKLRQEDIAAFERFISSIVRDKSDVKTIVFGNLLEKVSGIVGDPLLNGYGFNPECGCKGVQGKGEHEANILFINTKEMFKGVDTQGVIGGVHTLSSKALLHNTLIPKGIKTVSMREFLNSPPKHSLVFTYNGELKAIHIHMIPDENYLIIDIRNFVVSHAFAHVYTNEVSLFNTYSNIIQIVDDETGFDLIEELEDYLSIGRVLYANEESSLDINIYMKHFSNMTRPKIERFSEFKFGN